MSSKPSLSPKQLLSLDQTYEGNSAEKEIPAGSINNASSSKPLSQDSATSTSSETVDLVARLAQMTLAIGALVTEVGETNRTLKALVAEKHVEKGKDASNEIQYNPVPTSLLRPNQVPPQEARMQILRDTFLKGASDRPQDQLAGYVSEPGYSGFFLGFEGAMLIVCTNETRTPLEGDKGSKPLNSRHFKTTAQSQKVPKITECLDLIRSKWPLNTVSTDGDKILWRVISTDSMDCHLQLFDQISSGGLAVPESIVFPWDDSRQPREQIHHERICPGKLWSVTITRPQISLSVISFILAVLDTSLKEDEEEEISGFLEFVRRFYRRWSPLNRLDESHACSLGDVEIIVLQHHLRFFSAKEKYRPLQEALTPPFLVLHRVREEFPAYSGRSNRPLFEKRISLFCIAKKYPGGQHELPEFHIVVLKDGYIPSLDWGTEEFWSKNNMTVRGPPAAFQLFLAVIYEIIRFWEREWIACFKGLDGCITVQMDDIMNHTKVKKLMFDDSFERSKLYFKVLQLLRIFSDEIRASVRDLELLNMGNKDSATMEYLLRFLTAPLADMKALQDNWEIVMKSQTEAQNRLLKRIADKAEEIKSLRDGLFNATALLEASKSTTMNRYIIVFTIVTVIYLPPSFIATVFGTQLFNANDVAGTVDKFKVTTVTMSIVTYFVAFVLVMLADRVAKLLEAIGPKLRLAYKEIGIAITRLFSREAKKGEENPTSTV